MEAGGEEEGGEEQEQEEEEEEDRVSAAGSPEAPKLEATRHDDLLRLGKCASAAVRAKHYKCSVIVQV